MSAYKTRKGSGFSIIELMVTVAVIGVTAVVAGPALGDFVSDMRISAKTNDLLAFFQYARSEAAKRGTRVTVCISSDQATCATGGTDWARGAVAFIDTGAIGQVDGGDTVLRVLDAMPANLSVTATTAFGTGYYFQYRPSGTVSSAGTLRLCRSGRPARYISISAIGRPMSTTTPALTCA